MSEKTRVRITRARCMCSGCQEQGTIEFDDDKDVWCTAFEVVGSYSLWETVVKAIKADEQYEIVSDDSKITSPLTITAANKELDYSDYECSICFKDKKWTNFKTYKTDKGICSECQIIIETYNQVRNFLQSKGYLAWEVFEREKIQKQFLESLLLKPLEGK
jgi:hypothetical protein